MKKIVDKTKQGTINMYSNKPEHFIGVKMINSSIPELIYPGYRHILVNAI